MSTRSTHPTEEAQKQASTSEPRTVVGMGKGGLSNLAVPRVGVKHASARALHMCCPLTKSSDAHVHRPMKRRPCMASQPAVQSRNSTASTFLKSRTRWHRCDPGEPGSTGLLKLPAELILMIEGLADVPSVSALACTSRRLHDLLNPLLYRRIFNEQNLSALLWAAENGRVDTAKLCLSHGADINSALSPLEATQVVRHDPLAFHETLSR